MALFYGKIGLHSHCTLLQVSAKYLIKEQRVRMCVTQQLTLNQIRKKLDQILGYILHTAALNYRTNAASEIS